MAKKRQQKQQQRQKQQDEAAAAPPPPATENVMDSDDEEIDEDEAFNSDDERKYGIFFQDKKPSAKTKSNGGDDDDDDDDGDDSDGDGDDTDDGDNSEGDGGQYMLDLLDKLDDGKKKKGDDDDHQRHPQMVAHVKESAYSSSVVPSAGLTIDALMQDLKDTKGFGALAKTMKVVTKKSTSTKGGNSNGGATLAPLPRVQSDRLQRQIGHSKASDKMTSEWIETVQENRKAETLDFRGNLQQETLNKITATTMVETFTPTTDFEKEIHQALQQVGQLEEEAILQAEQEAILKQHNGDVDDDLGHAELTVEDLAKRRAQLAKMRALMFYHEQKRHHMNKIKSKKYRRIRKRQSERLKQADLDAQVEQNPDLEQELQEREHVERMQERMTLAHKNTSKWAKRILKRSKKGVDVDTRRALSAQLKRGDDLMQKMKTRNDNDGDDSSNDDDDDDDEDLVETARKVLADAENEEDDDDDNANRRSGLFKLAFMQRGIEKQKQQAREEARQLLEELKADRELEQGNNDNGDDNDDDYRNRDNKDTSKPQQAEKKASPPVASRQELKEILKDGGEMTTSRSSSSAIAVSGNIQIDMGDDGIEDGNAATTKIQEEEPVVSTRSEHTSMLQTTGGASSNSSSPPPPRPKNLTTLPKAKQASAANHQQEQQQPHNHPKKDNENDNPWLAAVADNDPNNKKKTKHSDKKKKNNSNKSMVDVDRAVDLLEVPHSSSTTTGAPTTSAESKKRKSGSSDNDDDDDKDKEEEQPQENKKQITHLSQEELVRRAFASTSAQDAEDDFAQEKAMVEEREDPLYKKKLADQKAASCKGWGSWAGKGAAAAPPPPLSNKKSLPPHLQPPAKKKQKRNDINNNNADDASKRKRRDGGKDHLIIRERRVKRMADQYMLHQVPYPYSCRQDYERAMAGGIGPEWNVTQSVKDLTRSEICTRAGKIIEPLSQQAKQKMNKKRKNPVSAKF